MSETPAAPVHVAGHWSGTWTPFDPARDAAPREPSQRMDAHVEADGDGWRARFEADCGGPYTFAVAMGGRRAGHVVLFKGTADLGPHDGGVFEWIGRATESEFAGFYVSAHYTGVFSLARAT